ncbi:MAG TPA: beta-ketoacyl-[acyl-carrier-protein] synthase family protein [Vicinamibacteria bacterium]|nr:beta-ketoacyl-[acyl-carrier-protein] synthase family protein [Vicinamibacteria bacterium]
MRRRVVVTGLGAVSAAGIGVGALADALRTGRSCVRTLDDESAAPGGAIGAPAPALDPLEFVSRRQARHLDRAALLCVLAGREALADSRLLEGPIDRARVGVYKGMSLTGIGGSCLSALQRLDGDGVAAASASVSAACALALAVGHIRLGEIDAAVVGGGEAPLSRAVLASFARAGLLSSRKEDPETACRPFDATRDGIVLGEAGAAVVVESMDHALRRGARIHAEVAAVAVTSEAGSPVAPGAHARQRARALQSALRRGAIRAGEVQYVAAHGSATRDNDEVETAALKAALGDHAYGVQVSAMKSMLGHTLGASALLETVGTILAMLGGFLPPTINLRVPDPDCDLDYVPGRARPETVNVALVANAGVDGRNTAVLLRR